MKAVFCGIVTASAWISVADAQAGEFGSRIPGPQRAMIPKQSNFSDAQRGRVALLQYARCLLRRSKSEIVAAVSVTPNSAALDKIGTFNSSDCLDAGRLQVSPDVMRGAFFVQLWAERATMERAGQRWTPTMQPFDESAHAQSADENVRHNQTLLWFADCIVKRDRKLASDFVTAEPMSKAEDGAFSALRPFFAPCWSSGSDLKISKALLQGGMAEALYRSPAAPVAAKVN